MIFLSLVKYFHADLPFSLFEILRAPSSTLVSRSQVRREGQRASCNTRITGRPNQGLLGVSSVTSESDIMQLAQADFSLFNDSQARPSETTRADETYMHSDTTLANHNSFELWLQRPQLIVGRKVSKRRGPSSHNAHRNCLLPCEQIMRGVDAMFSFLTSLFLLLINNVLDL
jgi:hypothetical protein